MLSRTALLEVCQLGIEVMHPLLGCDSLVAFLESTGAFLESGWRCRYVQVNSLGEALAEQDPNLASEDVP